MYNMHAHELKKMSFNKYIPRTSIQGLIWERGGKNPHRLDFAPNGRPLKTPLNGGLEPCNGQWLTPAKKNVHMVTIFSKPFLAQQTGPGSNGGPVPVHTSRTRRLGEDKHPTIQPISCFLLAWVQIVGHRGGGGISFWSKEDSNGPFIGEGRGPHTGPGLELFEDLFDVHPRRQARGINNHFCLRNTPNSNQFFPELN